MGLLLAKSQLQYTHEIPMHCIVTSCGTEVHTFVRKLVALTQVVLRPTGSKYSDSFLMYMTQHVGPR